VLVEARVAGHDDGHEPLGPDAHDGGRAAVGDDGGGGAERLVELGRREVGLAVEDAGLPGGTGLGDDPHLRGLPREPVVHPADEAVEAVVVGAHRHDHERRVDRRFRRQTRQGGFRLHSNLPSSVLFG
jgi:hypothetical protein